MHEKFLQDLLSDAGTAIKILELLPEDPTDGFTIISSVVDKYSSKVGLSSRKVWKMLYTTEMCVHDEMGDME